MPFLTEDDHAMALVDGRTCDLIHDEIDGGTAEIAPLAFFTGIDAFGMEGADPLTPAVEHQSAIDQRFVTRQRWIPDEHDVDRIPGVREGTAQFGDANSEAARPGVDVWPLERQHNKCRSLRCQEVIAHFGICLPPL